MQPIYTSAGRTETGNVRSANEDAILVRDDLGLWAVADGLGGHAAGEIASGIVVERLAALERAGSAADLVERVEAALHAANAELRELAAERGDDLIASTVVVLLHDSQLMLCGWVGDSRAYCFENGSLAQLTRDHVAGAGDAGALTRAVGAADDLYVDWVVKGTQSGSCFVLCSDGVTKELSDADIGRECLRHGAPGMLVDALVDTALARAGRDNVSAVAVRLGDARTEACR